MLSADQKKLLTTGIAVVAGCALAWYLLVDRESPKPNTQLAHQLQRPPLPQRTPRDTAAQDDPRPLPPPMPVIKPATRPARFQPLEAGNPMPDPAAIEAEIPVEDVPDVPPEPAVALPVARFALGFVGADPQAEELWYAAINDPAMPANARQDLIEDLNEEGFDDPRNVTEDDLPLIYSRLAIIEQLAPDAMDDVNAAAFAEAYKDLVNMVLKLQMEAIAREEAAAQGQDITGGPPPRPLRGR